jgi:HSP20 family protein
MMAEAHEIQVQEAEKQEIEQSGAERTRSRQAFVPRVDIYETNEAMILIADMPGVTADSLEITLEQGTLTLNGYVDARPHEDYALAYAEYRIGDYVRSFTVSNQINQEAIEARLKDGVLHLHLPKEKPTTRKITVSNA